MMREYRIIILLLLFLAVGITTLESFSTASGKISPLDEGLIFIFSPFQRALLGVENFFSHVSNLGYAESQNRDLQNQVFILKQEVTRLHDVQNENEQLQNLLDFKNSFRPKTLAARIVGRDPSDWFSTLTISRGLADGARPDQAVIGDGYVVGKILDVSAHFSHVALLTNFRVAIPVEVLPDGSQGIAYGEGEAGCLVKYLPLDARIKPGDEVVTSGLGHIFIQKGIPLGAIASVGMDPQTGFFKQAFLRPFLNASSLQGVLIMRP